MLKDKKIPELLVPANNLNILKYAVNYGADAVYVGGKEFNLRSIRGNFSIEELEEGVRYAHKYGVKLYFTLNSIVYDHELARFREYLNKLKSINLDGIIVSDFGALELAKEILPGKRIHISTQTNINNHPGVNFFEKLGASRVNLAREINFSDLKNIIDRTNVEIEIFIHGALCISYSGRCMLSKYMTGRDANRGECAHSCRWKYYLMEEERANLFFPVEQDNRGTYIYNSRDLCLLGKLKLLVDIGVDAFKIEGRMKTENYVSLTTWVYRRALDYIMQNKFTDQKISYLTRELDKCSHRNFTSGFMFLKDRSELEDNDNVGYIKKYRFIGVYHDFSNKYNGPIINVKNQFRVGEVIDILQPYKNPKKFMVGKMISVSDNTETDCANPNDIVIIPNIGNLNPYAIFRIKI
ncbi:MAG: U32 family peptidase [Actinobacteria bacterium]|nr:U32 family peptidase [Actinomycetota bacterium]